MEKRKSKTEKVLTKFDEIIEEKLLLEDNLKLMLDHLWSYVRYVRSPTENMRESDVTEILKYEIQLLAMLVNMNFDMEKQFEEAPTSRSNILKSTSGLASTVLDSLEKNVKRVGVPELGSDIKYTNTQRLVNEILASDHRESAIVIPTGDPPSPDLNSFKDSLKQSSVLGLNKAHFSSQEKTYTDYIPKQEKPSKDFEGQVLSISSQEKPSTDIYKIQTNLSKEKPSKEAQTSSISSQCIITKVSIEDSDSSEEPFREERISAVSGESSEDINDKPEIIPRNCSKLTNSSTSGVGDTDTEDTSEPETSSNFSWVGTTKEFQQISKHSLKTLNNENSNNIKATSSTKANPSSGSVKKKTKFKVSELRSKRTPSVGDECLFSHIVSPSEFYIHLLDYETVSIDDLSEKIHQNYNRSLPTHSSKELACSDMGRYCLAYVSQFSRWFRAEVLDWYFHVKSDEVLIQLVDYGNKQTVTYQNLRVMLEELSNIPKLAVRCHFPLLYPPTATRLNRTLDWPEDSINALADLSVSSRNGENQEIPFRIVYAEPEGDSLGVDFCDCQETNEELTVAQILLDLGLAKEIIEEYDEEHMELEVFLDDVDDLETADNINEAIAGYDAKDEARICPFTRKDGTCYKGKSCKLEHASLSKDGFTTDKELVFKNAMCTLMLPACGECVTVLVTCYIDICRFFVQIIRTPHKESKYMIDKQFYSLLAVMNSPKAEKSYESFKILPAIGEIVLVKHWSKKWLRAVVREIGSSSQSETDIHVFTVDVGETLKVTLKDLRKIQSHLLNLPFQAVECYINDYKMKEGCCTEKAMEFFNRNLYFHNFLAVTMSYFPPLRITLKTLNGLIDIGKTLKEQNFAEVRPYDNNPLDTSVLKLY
nr:uncharacterized protein LOC111507152 [Leptinotarsa decemlineata]